jgi:hypothetical protein
MVILILAAAIFSGVFKITLAWFLGSMIFFFGIIIIVLYREENDRDE